MKQLKNNPPCGACTFFLFLAAVPGCTDGMMKLITVSESSDETDTDATDPINATDTDTEIDTATDTAEIPCPDADRDGICDMQDNCPREANPEQEDADGDGIGDVCDPCPDVSDAAQKPYMGMIHRIPGTIEVEFYDEGGTCVAWMDIDTENRGDTEGFRTDEGVDAHSAQVEEDGDYVVGYTYAGEWVEYTVTAQAGKYDAVLRYSSELFRDTEATVELRWNEQILGVYTFQDTATFAVFNDAVLRAVEIPASETGILRLVFQTQYVNYTRITFAPAP